MMKKVISVLIFISMLISVSVMAVSVSADYTESPSNEEIKVVEQGHAGKKYDALIFNGNDVVAGVNGADGGIFVTPYNKLDSANESVDKEAFKNAYNEIKNATSLKALNSSLSDNAVVRDVFDITLSGESAELFKQYSSLQMKFDLGIYDKNVLNVMVRGESGWEIVKNVTVNGDGTVTVVFDKVGPVAFVVDKAESAPSEDPDAPQTSDALPVILMSCVIAGSSLCYISFKRSRISSK